MGFLMLAGLLGTIGYMGYYAKQETTAMIGDKIIQPSNTKEKDKEIIKNNFKLICKRGNAKIDNNGNPINKDSYKPCMAYLQYQGFQDFATKYFKELYLKKYNNKYQNEIQQLKDKHWSLELHLFDEPHEVKVVRHWDYGDTQTKCEKLMQNWLWMHMVKHYNIVKDGISNVEVWTISAPPSYIKQIDTIYNEVCQLELYNKNE